MHIEQVLVQDGHDHDHDHDYDHDHDHDHEHEEMVEVQEELPVAEQDGWEDFDTEGEEVQIQIQEAVQSNKSRAVLNLLVTFGLSCLSLMPCRGTWKVWIHEDKSTVTAQQKNPIPQHK